MATLLLEMSEWNGNDIGGYPISEKSISVRRPDRLWAINYGYVRIP